MNFITKNNYEIKFLPLSFSFVVSSQDKDSKVGLVLSRGRVKGFANISVLKEIDK